MGADVGADVSGRKQWWFLVSSHRFLDNDRFGQSGHDKTR